MKLTDAVYLDFALEQLSYAEQRLFPTDDKTYEDWVVDVRSTNPWVLPKYRAIRSLAIPKLPERSLERKKTKDRKAPKPESKSGAHPKHAPPYTPYI